MGAGISSSVKGKRLVSPAAQGRVEQREASLGVRGCSPEVYLGQEPRVVRIGQEADDRLPSRVDGRYPQIEQGGGAAQMERPVVRIAVRHGACGVAVQLEGATARPEDEPPGLGVMHGRSGDGVLDQRHRGCRFEGLCGHGRVLSVCASVVGDDGDRGGGVVEKGVGDRIDMGA